MLIEPSITPRVAFWIIGHPFKQNLYVQLPADYVFHPSYLPREDDALDLSELFNHGQREEYQAIKAFFETQVAPVGHTMALRVDMIAHQYTRTGQEITIYCSFRATQLPPHPDFYDEKP